MTTNAYGSLTPPQEIHDDPLADVFGSNAENGSNAEQPDSFSRSKDGPSDIPRLRSIHVTNGYREGIAQGKESSMQAGFDEGYALGAEIGMAAGRLLGLLAGLVSSLSALKDSGAYAGKKTLSQLLESARAELDGEKLFSQTFFDEDGIWTFPVAGSDVDEDVTFRKVAAAHPLIIKWTGIVEEIMQTQSLRVTAARAEMTD